MGRRDFLTKEARSALMARIRSRDTGPEKAVAKLLGSLKVTFRAQARDLPGRPDFVPLGYRLAIFVNGDFWHGQVRKEAFRRLSLPWRKKLERNRMRDGQAKRKLWRLGWSVLTIWESELEDRAKVSERIRRALRTS